MQAIKYKNYKFNCFYLVSTSLNSFKKQNEMSLRTAVKENLPQFLATMELEDLNFSTELCSFIWGTFSFSAIGQPDEENHCYYE